MSLVSIFYVMSPSNKQTYFLIQLIILMPRFRSNRRLVSTKSSYSDIKFSLTMTVLRQVLIFFTLGFTLCECSDENVPLLPVDLHDPVVDVMDYIKDKCAQKGQTNIVEDMKTESKKSVSCIRKYVNGSLAVQDDLRKALLANDIDGFFMKYCGVWPEIHVCFQNTINLIKSCLNDTEKQQIDESLEVMDSMQSFICADNASEMTNFYRVGGVEKFQDNWVDIKKCVSSRGRKTIIFDSDRCDYVEWFRVCTTEGMKKSINSTAPAETMNEMFVTIEEKYCPTSGSSTLSNSIPLIGLIILSLLRFTNTMESYMIQV
ncbi:unnamed protein product [Phaedon cochleariae]|uniref:Uncharacterized protein n=1 Tax=Phaedon cochleariae TaxID=80249 RepID=A0A9P0DJY0_PHACE|nr:unnamed protein product [Phaedon cochleariae]